jgi:hypothetical protein
LNPRPSGYEPDELPNCSTPRCGRKPSGDIAHCQPPSARDCEHLAGYRTPRSGARFGQAAMALESATMFAASAVSQPRLIA